MAGPLKVLTPKQMKFAQLIVYGVDGTPITKTEAARLAGYTDSLHEGTRLTNPNKNPLVCAHETGRSCCPRTRFGGFASGRACPVGPRAARSSRSRRDNVSSTVLPPGSLRNSDRNQG